MTLQMSHASQPTIPYVLPMYEQMKKKLSEYTMDPDLSPILQSAAAAGLTKMNKYHGFAQKNHFYHIGTSEWFMLAPCFC